MVIKKWIKEEIPVKPSRSRRCERSLGAGAPRQVHAWVRPVRRNRSDAVDVNQPRIAAFFTRIPNIPGAGNGLIQRNVDNAQQRVDRHTDGAQDNSHGDQEDPANTEEDNQLMGRPPDIQLLRTP